MYGLEPVINLLVLLSVLSIVAERLANAIKLRSPALRTADPANRKERERLIANRAMAVSIVLALLLKADFFEIVAHLDAPWTTLSWTRGPFPAAPVPFVAAVAGSVLTGVSLGFGSKFWHEVLDAIGGLRARLREAREIP